MVLFKPLTLLNSFQSFGGLCERLAGGWLQGRSWVDFLFKVSRVWMAASTMHLGAGALLPPEDTASLVGPV